ncbi:MAG: type II toxin-antitoxin system MqsA family antitoxin [Candidatus Parabeggiatoa sp. nov. 1]|nr:MAG: type II toxin-antitoxin system MqsA family antitoxin [Gammaproteobacteria bacterium]
MTKKCNFCGSEKYEERRIDYLYTHDGQYLLVPNTPVEICLDCGAIYYDVQVLKNIEQHFFAIQNRQEKPDNYISMPTSFLSERFELSRSHL